MLGVALTSWTIRLALLGYIIVLAGWLSGQPASEKTARRLRWIWTLSCLLFVTHVACAFHFYHHWSHQHAVADTALQTKQLLGWAFGEGLYFSYVFLLVWVADVLWWWTSERTYLSRPAWIGGLIHIYLLFIAFNGAIVFKGGVTRYAGALSLLALGGLIAKRALTQRSESSVGSNRSAPFKEPAQGPDHVFPVCTASGNSFPERSS